MVHAEVEEAAARVRLLTLEAQRQLTVLLLDAKEADGEAVLGRVADWNGQLAEIRRAMAGWAAASEREQGRVSDRMAGGGPSVLDLTQLINQDRLDLVQKTLVALQGLDIAMQQADLLLRLLAQAQVQREGRLWDWLTRGQLTLEQFWHMVTHWLSQSLFKLGDIPVTAMGLVRVALILFFAWLISYWWRRVLKRLGERHEGVNQAALYTFARLSHYVIITLGLVLGLASIGVNFTNFALLASAIAIGMGFGLQSIVSNFISGLILMFERSLKVGDFVELASGIEGEVPEINVRSTRINTNDNVDIVVPNSEFINTKLINWTLQENYRRIHVPFRVAFGTNIDLVTEAALEAAERVTYTMKTRRASVWVVDFGENGLEFELVVWIRPEAVKRPGAVKAAYKKEIALALYRHGIEVPVPQRDLWLRAGFEERERPRRPLGKLHVGGELDGTGRD